MTTERLSIGDMVESDNGPLLGGTTPECFVTHLHMCSDGHVQAAWQRLNTSRGSQPAYSLNYSGRSWTDEERASILARMKSDETLDERDRKHKALLFDGCEVEYQPSKAMGRWYKAIAAGAPHMCGSTPVVRLRDIEPAYSRDHHPGRNRTTVAAAALDCIRIPVRGSLDGPAQMPGKAEGSCPGGVFPSECKAPTAFRPVDGGCEARFCLTCGIRFETRAPESTDSSGDGFSYGARNAACDEIMKRFREAGPHARHDAWEITQALHEAYERGAGRQPARFTRKAGEP